MIIKNAQFVTSVASDKNILESGLPEIAVAGKSNVGKSSFINFITNHGKLAKTSKEPGRTRLVNYFSCNNNQFMLVDLPGYGFARVSDAEKEKWGTLIEGYLQNSKTLRSVFVLLDIRRVPSDDDKMMINYLHHYCIPMTIIATKADKLTRNELNKNIRVLAQTLAIGIDNIFVTSSFKKTGAEKVFARIEDLIAPREEVAEDESLEEEIVNEEG
ncbi:MAG: ribosome biogenesis GTP-binding protein YihA/YsxC [Bacillota bacterium]